MLHRPAGRPCRFRVGTCWPHSHHVDQCPQPAGNVAMAGVVQAQPRHDRAPVGQHAFEPSVFECIANEMVGHEGDPDPSIAASTINGWSVSVSGPLTFTVSTTPRRSNSQR